MAFPERGQADSVAFAFRVRFTAGAGFGEGGLDLVTVDRLGDRRAAVPDQVGNVLQAGIVRAEDGHERECRSSRGVHAPPSRAALMILPNSCRTCQRSSGVPSSRQNRDRALATSPPLRAVRRLGGGEARGALLRLVPAEHQDSQAKSPAHEQVGDLEQHPASQPSPHHPFRRNGSSTMRSSFRAAQVLRRPVGPEDEPGHDALAPWYPVARASLRTATGRSAGVPGRCAAATAAGRPPPGRR